MTVAQGTPRTDQAAIEMSGTCEDDEEGQAVVGIRFARQLEREVAALSAQVVELQKEKEQIRNLWTLVKNGFDDYWMISSNNDELATKLHYLITSPNSDIAVPPSVKDSGT